MKQLSVCTWQFAKHSVQYTEDSLAFFTQMSGISPPCSSSAMHTIFQVSTLKWHLRRVVYFQGLGLPTEDHNVLAKSFVIHLADRDASTNIKLELCLVYTGNSPTPFQNHWSNKSVTHSRLHRQATHPNQHII